MSTLFNSGLPEFMVLGIKRSAVKDLNGNDIPQELKGQAFVATQCIDVTRSLSKFAYQLAYLPAGYDGSTKLSEATLQPVEIGPVLEQDLVGTDVFNGYESAPYKSGKTFYTIQDGDNLDVIAQKFGVTINTLASDNPEVLIDRYQLPTGKTITVAPNSEDVTNTEPEVDYYTVQSGDSLKKIASDNHTTMIALQRLNNREKIPDVDTIKVGDRLRVK